MTAYAACTDYASILNSCASATPSFYSLPASQQASCVCYTPSSAALGCSISPTTVDALTPTLATTGRRYATVSALAISRFDDPVDACYEFFNLQGYTNIAGTLYGRNSRNETLLGWGFCANVDADLSASASATATETLGYATTTGGLPNMIDPTPSGECYPYVEADRYSGGVRVAGLTPFDRMVLVSRRSFWVEDVDAD